MLSPKEWAVPGHASGESWTLEKIHGVRDKVADGLFSDKEPSDIKGVPCLMPSRFKTMLLVCYILLLEWVIL
jgi:hypothetical protein